MFSAAELAARLRWFVRSSTLRLTLLLSGVFAAGMVIAIVLALSLGRDAVMQRIDASLEATAATLEADDDMDGSAALLVRPLSDLNGLPPGFARVARSGGGTVTLDDEYRRSENWRVLVTRDSEGEPTLIAAPLDDSDDALELLGQVLWTTAAAVLAIAVLIGLFIGLVAQRRLSGITKTLDRLAAGDLHARTGNRSDADDLDDLARRLDSTADQLERLVTQTRHLSASIAHDMRTPLARLQARLEDLPDGEERDAALGEAQRLSGIFDTIMRVARIEAAQGRDGFEPVDLASLAKDVAEIFEVVVEDHGKTLRLEQSPTATIEADRAMLIQALANLIQNAIVHGGPTVTLLAHGRTIGVADDGDGVDPNHYGEIIKPMVRLDAARANEGSGLGLALVRAVADRHGATLKLSPHAPQGLRVTLDFTDL